MTWRFVDCGAVDAPVMFGRMPVLAASVVNRGPEILMTGMFGSGHFQIGWFDDVDAVMDLDAARALGVQVFRRPLFGGGAAFYDTNAVAFFSFINRAESFPSLDDALEHFRPTFRRVLDDVGLSAASFEGSSDIRWNGRKLGTVISQDVLGTKVVGGFLNLRKPDLELYAKVARVPEEKFKDKIIKDAVEYICTPKEVRGEDLSYDELRDAVVRESRLVLEALPITPQEDENVAGFVSTVSADDWIHRVSTSRFVSSTPGGCATGFANVKGKKLVRAGVALGDDGVIVQAMLGGDMHVSPPDAMDRVAVAVEGARADDRAELLLRARAIFESPEFSQPDAAAGITPEDCVEAIQLAAKNAR